VARIVAEADVSSHPGVFFSFVFWLTLRSLSSISLLRLALSLALSGFAFLFPEISLPDRTVKIFQVSETSSELAATLQGHEGPVWQVSWAHPKFGVLLASCGFDGSVLVHQQTHHYPQQQQRQPSSSSSSSQNPRGGGGRGAVGSLGGASPASPPSSSWSVLHAARNLHESSVNSVSFAPHEYGYLWLAAASSDGRVSFLRYEPGDATWSASYVDEIVCQQGVNAVSWAPYFAYRASNRGRDGDGDLGEEDDPAVGGDPAQADAPRIVTGGCDNAVRFWVYDAGSGTWGPDPSPVSSSVAHTDWVRDVAWAPNLLPFHNTVASASEDGTVLIWRQTPETGGEFRAALLHKFPDPVWRVSWSVTGHLLAVSSGDSDVTLWKEGLNGKWSQVATVDDQIPHPSQE
jgi:protein transport protein SEC13